MKLFNRISAEKTEDIIYLFLLFLYSYTAILDDSLLRLTPVINLLKWGISVKGIFVPKECQRLMALLSEMPSSIISEMEKYPKESVEKIPRCIEKIKSGTVEKSDMILFPFEIKVPENIVTEYKKELDRLTKQFRKRDSKSDRITNEQKSEYEKS